LILQGDFFGRTAAPCEMVRGVDRLAAEDKIKIEKGQP
jgi:hypothetical protein